MLYFLISCLPFIVLSKSFFHKSVPAWEGKKMVFSASFWEELTRFVASWNWKSRVACSFIRVRTITMPAKKLNFTTKVEKVNEKVENSLLDLPDLALDCIFEQLSPAELCGLAEVCSSLRDRCRSDHLWEKHMKRKWGSVIGDYAYRERHLHKASITRPAVLNISERTCSEENFLYNWLFCWIKPRKDSKPNTALPIDSIKAWYLSLESGKIWFPAQVYNRENGLAGFALSCYDARLCYDSESDSFVARYSSCGRRRAEENIEWERLRAPPIDTSSHKLHASDCLNDLQPGDHVEIQWRRNEEFPYGWWYSVVGHLETCYGDGHRCHCNDSDIVILEFNQYAPGSRWRTMAINRKDHREKGNDDEGFYGGIRKLYKEDEIKRWKKHLWATQNL